MGLRPYAVVICSLIVALAVGWFVSGDFLYRGFVGIDPSGFPAGSLFQAIGQAVLPDIGATKAGLALAAGTLLLLAVIVFFLVRGSVRSKVAETDPARRSFLTGAASGAGAALGSLVVGAAAAAGRFSPWMPVGEALSDRGVVKTHPDWKQSWKGSRVQSYRRFGRTEFMVSDIVVGAGPLRQEADAIPRLAIERGVNYIDTAPDYSATGSEIAVGKAIKDAGRRDEIFLATKWCTPVGHLPAGTPVTDYMASLEASLSRLGTDYVDLVHVHACDELPRLMDENMHEAFERLKKEGKVRFLGFSSHTPRLLEVANAAVDSGRFDVMMLAYHHGIWPQLKDVIARARAEQDMGIVAMKTLKGARHHGLAGFREEADAYSQAALKWVLSNPDVSCAVISFFELQHVDEYLYASGEQLTERDLAILRKYDEQILGSYCAPHCGACLSSCPEGVPIHDVLRHRMYFENYGWEKEAMRLYSRLEVDASACSGCSARCLGSCPVGIPIAERTAGAHDLLRIA
jgi:predicted aldo/keto reductase-like oxidoreductase